MTTTDRNTAAWNMKEIIKVLHPIRYATFHENSPGADMHKKPQRFSTLLLEHGEQELQDWGVIASSRRCTSSSRGTKQRDDGALSVSSSSGVGTRLRDEGEIENYSKYKNVKSKSSSSLVDNNSAIATTKERDPSDRMKSIKGRLHLCSKSMVFQPDDMSRGIIRIPFEKMSIPPSSSSGGSISSSTRSTNATTAVDDASSTILSNQKNNEDSSHSERWITLQTKRYIVMKKNNKIAPYETYDKRVWFKFTFQHSSTQSFLQLFEQIYNLPLEQLQSVIKPMCDRPFDASNFMHLNEVPMTVNLRAFILGPFPLVKKAGCVIVTDKRLYFQPFNGVYSEMASKALSWCLEDVVSFARRYHGLKDEALEIFFRDGPSVLLAFEGCRNREEVLRLLPNARDVEGVSVPVFCHTDRSFLRMVVDAWRRGMIDNFEYLLALNSAAGRSLFDLSRYPVFPWVLSDYESEKLDMGIEVFRDLTKPIGALNKERLENFKARWNNMQDMGDAFLYGTHYSAPGYCLYYLVRTMPEQMLCLQNGEYSVCNCWLESKIGVIIF
jgi:factor associated with neutral sphingomyelinase activation